MPEYTLLTVLAGIAVVVAEVALFRTGIFRTPQYWLAMAIVFFFQVIVDGTGVAMELFPNPCRDVLNVRIPDAEGDFHARVEGPEHFTTRVKLASVRGDLDLETDARWLGAGCGAAAGPGADMRFPTPAVESS